MNTNLKSKEAIQEAFNDLFTFDSEQEEVDHEAEMIMFQFLSEIEKVMENQKINKKDLAEIIGTSPSYITQLFRGDKLVNLKMLARFKKGLNIEFEIKIKKEQAVFSNISDASYNSILDQKFERRASDLLASIIKGNTRETNDLHWSEPLSKVEAGESYTSLAA